MMLVYPRAASVWSTILWILIIILLILLILYLVWLFTRKREKAETGRAEAAIRPEVAPPSAPAPPAEMAPPVTTPPTPTEAAAEVPPDDLTRIEGIGPKVAQVLNSIGITTFAALANADYTKVKQALADAGWPYMDPAGWIEQARLAAEGKWEELAALQERLKGGRQTS